MLNGSAGLYPSVKENCLESVATRDERCGQTRSRRRCVQGLPGSAHVRPGSLSARPARRPGTSPRSGDQLQLPLLFLERSLGRSRRNASQLFTRTALSRLKAVSVNCAGHARYL